MESDDEAEVKIAMLQAHTLALADLCEAQERLATAIERQAAAMERINRQRAASLSLSRLERKPAASETQPRAIAQKAGC